jgi:hypothetical protein
LLVGGLFVWVMTTDAGYRGQSGLRLNKLLFGGNKPTTSMFYYVDVSRFMAAMALGAALEAALLAFSLCEFDEDRYDTLLPHVLPAVDGELTFALRRYQLHGPRNAPDTRVHGYGCIDRHVSNRRQHHHLQRCERGATAAAAVPRA